MLPERANEVPHHDVLQAGPQLQERERAVIAHVQRLEEGVVDALQRAEVFLVPTVTEHPCSAAIDQNGELIAQRRQQPVWRLPPLQPGAKLSVPPLDRLRQIGPFSQRDVHQPG